MRLQSDKVAEILNNATENTSLLEIERQTGSDRSTIWKVLKDFPLWDFVRKPKKYKIDN